MVCRYIICVHCLTVAEIRKIYDVAEEDITKYIPRERLDNNNYCNEIVLDPDDIMPNNWRTKFKKLCESYSDIITPITVSAVPL